MIIGVYDHHRMFWTLSKSPLAAPPHDAPSPSANSKTIFNGRLRDFTQLGCDYGTGRKSWIWSMRWVHLRLNCLSSRNFLWSLILSTCHQALSHALLRSTNATFPTFGWSNLRLRSHRINFVSLIAIFTFSNFLHSFVLIVSDYLFSFFNWLTYGMLPPHSLMSTLF